MNCDRYDCQNRDKSCIKCFDYAFYKPPKKKLYSLKVNGVKTKEEMEETLYEINCCEFCNNESFELSLLQFERQGSVGVALVEVKTQDDHDDIEEMMYEMLNCEFCHPDMSYQTM